MENQKKINCEKCNSTNLEFVKYKFKNGTINIRQQCFDCGRLHLHNFKRKNFKLENLSFVNKKLKNEFSNKMQNLGKIKSIFFNYSSLHKDRKWKYYFNVYLKSDEWKHKRELLMNYYKWECQECNNKATDIHHKTYDNIFCEKFEDLIPLCRKCHNKKHNI